MFILYNNDTTYSTKSTFLCTLFADDVSIFNANDDLENHIDVENSELILVNSLLKVNKLALNVHETKLILFNPYYKHVSVNNLKLCIDRNQVSHVTHVIFENLYYIYISYIYIKHHISYIKFILSRNIGVRSKVSFLLDGNSLFRNCIIHYSIHA